MDKRILNALLIVTSLIGYLEWGEDKSMFLFQGEWDVLSKMFSDPMSIVHPLTILPMVGQLLLLITLFQNPPKSILTYSGIACIGSLLFMVLLVGMISGNVKIIISALPFFVVVFLVVRERFKRRKG